MSLLGSGVLPEQESRAWGWGEAETLLVILARPKTQFPQPTLRWLSKTEMWPAGSVLLCPLSVDPPITPPRSPSLLAPPLSTHPPSATDCDRGISSWESGGL